MKLGEVSVINTGASGAIPRDDSEESTKRRNNHAERYYAEIRKRSSDVSSIAKNTGFSIEEIQAVKNHVFYNYYDLGDDDPERFDPDYDMSVSWQRLIEGSNIQEMDLVLLRHELMEYRLMSGQGLSYREAHDITEITYNYKKYILALDEAFRGRRRRHE
jgi:hypothetical protein